MQPAADDHRDRQSSNAASSAAASGDSATPGTAATSRVGQTVVKRPLRNVGKRLDEAGELFWIVDANDRLIYLNTTTARWLQVDANELLGQICHAAGPRQTVAQQSLASLAVPIELVTGDAVVRAVKPPAGTSQSVRFSRHGQANQAIVLAVGGAAAESLVSADGQLAADLRRRLEPWRQASAAAGRALLAGTSPHAVRLRAQVQLAAVSRQPLSISGPRGCGSEQVAQWVHETATQAAHSSAQLIVVDTPLMDADLLQATLAPAIAALQQPVPATITVVLRDVDDAAADIQDRLIDFASQTQATRSGHGTPAGQQASAVRLIGLLGQSLATAAAHGQLTPRLALALSIQEIALPPLVDRLEDLPLMATAALERRYVLGQTAAAAAKTSAAAPTAAPVAQSLSQSALDRLLLYPWPDNWVELHAAIRHASQVARKPAVQAEDLPLAIRSYRASSAVKPPAIVNTNLDDAIRDFEQQKIEQAMEAAGGNRAEAARLLGISRTRLLRKLDDQDQPSS